MADVGLVGLPNAGKSTILSRVSNAKPKIADYPFTTLEPNLGVVRTSDVSFVVADVPGLIAGASEGKGLGDKFLRHIERSGVIAHIVDINGADLEKDYNDIRNELKAWNPNLISEKEIVVLNKIDTMMLEDAQKIAKKFGKKIKQEIILVSAVSGIGIDEFIQIVSKEILKRQKSAQV